MVAETWVPVTTPGFEDLYEVSSHGRVRSLTRRTSRATYQGRVLKLGEHNRGYRSVVLSGRGKRKTVLVHTLVLESFVSPCPPGNEGRHLNGVRSDNRLENLAWGTSSENERDKRDHGTTLFGQKNGNAKLSPQQVQQIISRNAAGESQRALASEFGISQPHVHRLVHRKQRTHS